jgi:hypothetical protein
VYGSGRNLAYRQIPTFTVVMVLVGNELMALDAAKGRSMQHFRGSPVEHMVD